MNNIKSCKQPFTWEGYQRAVSGNPSVAAEFLEVFSLDHLTADELKVLRRHFESMTASAMVAVDSLSTTCIALQNLADELETRH